LNHEQLIGNAEAHNEVATMQRCIQCKKILFRKKDGTLACPNECDQSGHRRAFNTVIDPMKDRRVKAEFDPWNDVRY
jgi:uncharacterized Zn finger protein (UPF0148 family)